jgi:hypothetical protein
LLCRHYKSKEKFAFFCIGYHITTLNSAASIIRAMTEAARTSETSVDNYFTRQYIPEDKSERYVLGENQALKLELENCVCVVFLSLQASFEIVFLL